MSDWSIVAIVSIAAITFVSLFYIADEYDKKMKELDISKKERRVTPIWTSVIKNDDSKSTK